MNADIAVVGAGLAGLVCAQRLVDAGRSVVLFDKGRKPGGRLSTRRADPTRFDHGAPLLTAGRADFRDQVERWVAAGVVAPWLGRFVTVRANGEHAPWPSAAWVGVPSMSAIPAALAEGLDVRAPVRVGAMTSAHSGWALADEHGAALGRYETVVVNVPSGQAEVLVSSLSSLQAQAASADAHMHPCWAVMVVPVAPWDPGFDAAEFDEGPLSRVVSQANKPGRDAVPGWVLHARADWTRAHWEDDPQAVVEALVGATSMGALRHAQAHRWRYARSTDAVPGDCLWDEAHRVGACGDWCGGPGVEGAWRSGVALAQALLGS